MKLKPYIACLVFFTAFYTSMSAECEQSAIDMSVPIIAVDLDRSVTAQDIEGVLSGLGSPVIRGKEMLERMSLIEKPSPTFIKAIRVLFSKAQDNFFSGKHEQADREFTEIIEKARSNQINILSQPGVREIVFKSYVQRAVIAHESGDDERVRQELVLAAEKFSDLEPTSREFPPWVCERYGEIRSEVATDDGEVQVETSGLIHSKLMLRSGDLALLPEGEAGLDLLVKDAVALAKRGDWKRLVVIVGKSDTVEVWLLDVDFFGVLRAGAAPLGETGAAQKAVEPLIVDKPLAEEPAIERVERPWYKDPLAWAVTGAGAAMLAAALSMGMVYGNHSKMEPWAYSLYTVGGGAVITGTVLFFIPPLPSGEVSESKEKSVAIGLTAVIPF